MTQGRNVPFFNYPDQFLRQEKEIMAVLHDVMSRGAYILQKDLKEFEDNLAKFLGVKHVFGVADGSNAITLALIAAGIGPGDEVIVPSHTFIASPSAIHAVGATPVLADCGRDHMICPESVKSLVTAKTKAIMPVQLNGRTANMEAIQAIADQHGLLVIEDAAQALGSKFKGKFAATFGAAGTFSFYPAKLLGCFGDGGAVVTNDDKIAAQLYMLRDHGRDPEGMIRRWGFNSRLDNIQAAILNFKLKGFEGEITRRRQIARMYQQNLGSLAQLQLPPGPDADADHFDVYQNYEIEADDRDQLQGYLKDHGVRTLVQWGGTAVHQFAALGFTTKPAYTEKMFTRCVMIPMNTTLTDEDVDYVCEKIHAFYKTRG